MVYYAIEYVYGQDVLNCGARADKVRAFDSRAMRDGWVRLGAEYSTEPGFREALLSNDPRVAAYREHVTKGGA